MTRPTNRLRIVVVVAAAALMAGCTSDPAPDPATSANSGLVAAGTTGSADGSDGAGSPGNPRSSDNSNPSDPSGAAGTSDDAGATAGPGSADGSAAAGTDAAVEPVGRASCLEVPEIIAAGKVPPWQENDPAHGSIDKPVAFGTTVTWKGGVSLKVAEPKKYRPTAAEKKEITRQNGSRSDAEKMRDFVSIDVTVTNNSGGALALPFDGESVWSGLNPGAAETSETGSFLGRAATMMLADGEQTTVTRTAAVPDGSDVQYLVTPYDDATERTFSHQATIDRSSPGGDFEPAPSTGFGKEIDVGNVTISLSAPAPVTPSAAATPLSAAGFLAGTATVANSSDEPISLENIMIDVVAGDQSCGRFTDPALQLGKVDGLSVAPGDSRTVAYGFAAASTTVGDRVRATVTVVDGDDSDDRERGLFTGEIGTEGTEGTGESDGAPVDPLAGAVEYSPGGGDGAAAFGEPVSWQDSTQVVVEKPKKSDEGVEISFLAQGTNAEPVAEDSVVTILTGDAGFGIAGGEVDKTGKGYRWTALVTQDSFPGLSPAELPKATVVVAPAGHLPVISARKKPAEALTFAEPVAAQDDSVASITYGEAHEYADGIGVTVGIVEQQPTGHGDGGGSAGPELSRIRITNSSDAAYLLQPQLLGVQDGVAVPGGFHYDPTSPLVPEIAAVVPAGAAVDIFYTSEQPVEGLIVSPDPGRAPVLAAP